MALSRRLSISLFLLQLFHFSNGSIELEQDLDIHNKLKLATASLHAVLNLVYHRYEIHDERSAQFLYIAGNMPNFAWDILKYKFVLKILSKNDFLMIFGGSSVTAGWDVFFKQSYPLVFESHMKPIFSLLNISLKVHNIAQGANPCIPYHFCYEAMGGYSPDWIGWEQSFDCGRDGSMHELIARVAGRAKAVIHYSTSGGFTPSNCQPSKDSPPRISSEWTPETVTPLLPKYHINIEVVSTLRQTIHNWYIDGSSISRFTDSYYHPNYTGVGAHGFNLFATSNTKCHLNINLANPNSSTSNTPSSIFGRCSAMDVKPPCQHEGGLAWLTKEASTYASASSSNWHPTIGLHRLRGEYLVWLYGHILLDAIVFLKDSFHRGNSPAQIGKLVNQLLSELQPDLPPAKHCGVYCSFPASCFTNYHPHFHNNNTLSSQMIIRSSQWDQHVEDYYRSNEFGYLNKRVFYQSKAGRSLPIHLKIELKYQTFIILCGHLRFDYQTSRTNTPLLVTAALKDLLFYLESNISCNYDITSSYKKPSQTLQLLDNIKDVPWKSCIKIENIPLGCHILTLLTDISKLDKPMASLSHVITF